MKIKKSYKPYDIYFIYSDMFKPYFNNILNYDGSISARRPMKIKEFYKHYLNLLYED